MNNNVVYVDFTIKRKPRSKKKVKTISFREKIKFFFNPFNRVFKAKASIYNIKSIEKK